MLFSTWRSTMTNEAARRLVADLRETCASRWSDTVAACDEQRAEAADCIEELERLLSQATAPNCLFSSDPFGDPLVCLNCGGLAGLGRHARAADLNKADRSE